MINQPIGRCVSDFIVNVLSRGGGFKSEGTMRSYDDLVELARICLRQAREAKDPSVRAELRQLAKGYQIRAASMGDGRLPDIGEEDEWVRHSGLLTYDVVLSFDTFDGVGCRGAGRRDERLFWKDGGFRFFYPRGVFVELRLHDLVEAEKTNPSRGMSAGVCQWCFCFTWSDRLISQIFRWHQIVD
jgi:hypothetical protein